jgi:mannose-6-phosphate isomerase-like protein (cupin superfamily)
MRFKRFTLVALSAALIAGASLMALAAGNAVVVAKADLTWKELGVPGLAAAQVSGDMTTGASRFFLKYPVGFVTPKHHHTADHYATVVSGTIILTVNGKDYTLGPGSYFALTGMAPHIAKVVGDEDTVFFIQADGAWDVVMEE